MSSVLPRRHWQRVLRQMSPDRDALEISGIAASIEFPWDTQRATEFALFRTFAVPEIGELLAGTRAFTEETQKRFSDTMIILDGTAEFISGETQDRTAVRRLNRMHGAYDIPNDQMVYVLTTFVVPAVRWIEQFGYRPMSEVEIAAVTGYWQRVADLMGIRDVPADYDGFAAFMDAYERERFGFSPGGRAVADATLALIASWYPAPLRPVVRAWAIALLDAPVRDALGYDAPSALASRTVRAALAARRALLRVMPARRTPVRGAENRRVRGYADGWDISQVGTFPERAEDRA